ncbi:hypothetical protein [Dyella japonica]|uniref:Uncharacterized protein n=1 Tax=Dyella japonica A8 TaxID=1217721 RepID=A0A075KB44_9GAMM|nr:hypothetical protein [Dyella japonica]AIF49438.1 hypothetical protein HY57_20320 [Dyella japonica A8]
MKRTMISMVVALGIACIGQANAAVETYTVDMNGYVIVGFVGSTPAEVAQAQRLARNWEAQRHLMLKPQSMKAVAIRQSPIDALTQTELRSAIVSAALAKGP